MDCQVCRASAQLHFPHQKSTIFNTWIVRRSFCNKFIARQGKSTDNTLCIIEHFDVVLRRICRKNRTPFESPTATPRRMQNPLSFTQNTDLWKKLCSTMSFNEKIKLPQRKPLRLKGYDYSTPGAYFITICTKDRKHFLSEVRGITKKYGST